MDLQLTGLSAVVTGGSSGIGAAIVRALAEEGCHVAFCGRDPTRIDEMLRSTEGLPGRVTAQALDVTDHAAVERWFSELGTFDLFIANVSALSADWRSTIDVDVSSTIAATELAVPYLQASSRGALTYIGSKAGSIAAPRSAAYGAAKAAMAHYMKSMSSRLLPAVRVNTVSPGDTLVEGGHWGQVRDRDPEAFAKVVARNPMGRLATPEEIARVVTFISSPVASFVSGANWYVDGGSIAHVQV